MLDILKDLIFSSGAVSLTGGNLVMWLVAFVLFYLAIRKQYEPLLLLPMPSTVSRQYPSMWSVRV